MPGRKNILIVESDAQIVAELEVLLEASGYEHIAVVPDLGLAPAALDAQRVGAVLVSLTTPQISAQLASTRSLQQRFNVAVVYLVDEAAYLELEKSGSVLPAGYVMKPIFARELWAVLDAALRIHRLETRMKDVQRLESIGVVAGGIAHDFNNLITGIYGAVAIAHKELPEGSPVRQRLDQIERAATRAADLCQRLVVPPGTGSSTKTLLLLNEVAEEALKLVQDDFKPGVKLQTGFASDLPTVLAVEAQLRQVVVNLVANAAEAIGDRSGMIRVMTYAKHIDAKMHRTLRFPEEARLGDYVVFEVTDTGCGIEAAMIEKIFDPHYSTKNANRGLGLAAVSRIVRKHHGVISVESQLQQGSCFRVFLPKQTTLPGSSSSTSAPMSVAPFEARPIAVGVAPSSSGSVLVVDDDDTVRALAKWVIEKAGHSAVTARDGDEALRLFQADSGKFQLVLLDLTMPRMGGLEAMQKMRAVKPDQRIVIVTGHDENVLTGDVSEGDVGFMQKPFSPDRLRLILSKYLVLDESK